MSALAPLIKYDLSTQIAALPKHAGYSTLPPRSGEQYVTLHYSGVNYPQAATEDAEIRRILDEASYQLHHDYGTVNASAYPDGLLYDLVVLSSGAVVRTRAQRQQLWHCGNAIGNQHSWSVHLMLGPSQDATEAQWAGMIALFEALCLDYGVLRLNVVGHCEWPRKTGLPKVSTTYTILTGQSACPGKILHARLVKWRGVTTPPVPDWSALWGPIAPPDQTSWQWELPRLWKTHHTRLKQCISTMQGDDAHGLIVQCFEGGDIRGRTTKGKTVYEVCFK